MAIDQKTSEAQARLIQAIGVLEAQLNELGQALGELLGNVQAGQLDGLADTQKKTAEIRQWLEIALEVEMQLGKLNEDGQPTGAPRSLDLDEARSQIGCRLDRLRRARCPKGFPG